MRTRCRLFVGMILMARLFLLPCDAYSQSRPPTNEPFKGKKNPFLEVLQLGPYRIPVRKDSVRVLLEDGSALDLIMRNMRPWRLHLRDREGADVDCGNLMDGTGTVRLRLGKHIYNAQFVDGVLDGMAASIRMNGDTTMAWTFAGGLLHGECRAYIWDPRYVSTRSVYREGVVQLVEGYGKFNPLWGYLPLLGRHLRDPEFLCSRTTFENGRPTLHECFVKKCRRCGP